jgi:multiple antibiotic resistance protein
VAVGAIFPNDVLYEFVTLFVVLDPIATLPVFTAVTAGLNRRQSLLVGFYALGVSFLVLLFFIVAGQHLLSALKIPMASFQLAGSLVLLLFGLKMVLGKVTEEAADVGGTGASLLDRAIYPLAVPCIAGAGAMLTVVLLTDNKTRSLTEQVTTTGILVLCLAILFVMFALSAAIFRVLGRPGIEIVSRVFGLILASVAITSLIIAIKMSFGLPAG